MVYFPLANRDFPRHDVNEERIGGEIPTEMLRATVGRGCNLGRSVGKERRGRPDEGAREITTIMMMTAITR